MAFPRIQLWSLPLWGSKEERDNIRKLCSSNSSPLSDYGGFGVREIDDESNNNPVYSHRSGVWEIENVKFPIKGTKMPSSSSSSTRKIKKKWQSREERKDDRDHDGVLVPSDGVWLSESESEDSDWSIGWLEPHGPDFLSDDETDDSFAVLVPCYRNDRRGPSEGSNSQLLLNTIKNVTSEPFIEGKNLMEQWLSSLQNF